MTFREVVAAEFAPYGILTPTQLDQLQAHYDLLIRWNAKLNLTRIDSPEDAAKLHYCESLYLAASLPAGSLKIADIGSGAGFPGLPLAIFRPECQITLVESHQRKGVFLREATRDLPNIKVLALRAEEIPGPFDWIVSRAVKPEDVLRLTSAANFALLIGEEDARLIGEGHSLPWGIGRFAAGVPRGTISPPAPRS
ncbi:MAG: 16S rRNA (guanine(527)-N(7))-methyltransferase RsmG [Acidobacteriota bacterium]